MLRHRRARTGLGGTERPQHQPRLHSAVPLVQLEANGGVEAIVERFRQRGSRDSERDGPCAGATARDGETRVLAFAAHAAHFADPGGGYQQRGAWVAVPERAQAL